MTTGEGAGRATADAGYATVWVLAAMALIAVVAAAAISYGIALVASARAASAADAAGLTAALWAVDGPAAACARSAAMARLDGGLQTRCAVAGAVAEVVVCVPLPGPLAVWGPAVGRARAGPAAMADSAG
jgi:secretion/DNA translocation related TadE-like protein